MRRIISTITFLTLVFSIVGLQAYTKKDAQDLVKKAETYLKQNGKDKLVMEAQKSPGMFDSGEMYIYIIDTNATVLSHSKLPTWVGKSFTNLKDAEGKYFIKEALDTLKTKDECWIVYKWNNPVTKQVGTKHGYFKKAGDVVIASGVWE